MTSLKGPGGKPLRGPGGRPLKGPSPVSGGGGGGSTPSNTLTAPSSGTGGAALSIAYTANTAVWWTVSRNGTPNGVLTPLSAGTGTFSYTPAAGQSLVFYLYPNSAGTGSPVATSSAVTIPASGGGGGPVATVATGGGTPSGTLGAVPTFRIQGGSTGIAIGDPITLGHAFARGHVPSGLVNALQVTSGGATAVVQTDQRNAWPADGSLRYASLSFFSPVAIASGASATFTFSAASSNLSGNAVTAAGLASLSDFFLQVGGYDYTSTSYGLSNAAAPSSSTFATLVNSSSLTVAGGGSNPLTLAQPAQSGDSLAMALQALSGSAETYTAIVDVTGAPNQAHSNLGMVLRNSTTGYCCAFIVERDTNSIGVVGYSSPTQYSAGLAGSGGTYGINLAGPFGMRVVWDGSNYTFLVSQTCAAGGWTQVAQLSASTCGSPNQVGFYLDNYCTANGSTSTLKVDDWEAVSGTASYNSTVGQAASTGQVTTNTVADVFATHVNDITANLTQWNTSTGYGTNPLGGWRYTRLGPVCTEVEAWRMMKRVSDGASHRWVKAKFYARVWQLGGGGYHLECVPSLRQDQPYAHGHPSGTAGANTSQQPYRILGNAVLYNGSTALAYYGGPNDPRTVTTDQTVFNVSAGTLSSTSAAATVQSWAWDKNGRYTWGATPIVFSGAGVPSGITQNSVYFLSNPLYLVTNRANSMEYDGSNKVSMGTAATGSVTVTPVAMTTGDAGWFGALRDASIPWVGNGGYARPRYMVAHDATYLFRKTRILPPYQLNLSVPYYNDVHGTKGFSLNRPPVCGNINDYGDDPDDLRIGYMSRHQVNLALNPFDPTRELIVLSMGWAQADMQIWASDFRTGLPINGSSDAVTGFVSNGGLFLDTGLRSDGTSTSYPFAGWDFSKDYYYWSYNEMGDPSHYPWYITMPLLRTGHAAFQEMTESAANTLVLTSLERSPPNQLQLSGAIDAYHNGSNIRSVGWYIRSQGCADRLTDDASPVRPLTRYNLSQANAFYNAGSLGSDIAAMNTLGLPFITSNTSPFTFHSFFHYHAAQGIAMEAWCNDYPGFAKALTKMFGIATAFDNNYDYFLDDLYDLRLQSGNNGDYISGTAVLSTWPTIYAEYYPNKSPQATGLYGHDTYNGSNFLPVSSGQVNIPGIPLDFFAALAMASWPDSNPMPDAITAYNHMMIRVTTSPFVGFTMTGGGGGSGQGGETDCFSQFSIAPVGS